MKKLNSDEYELLGHWRLVGSSMEGDEVCRRIEMLIENYLVEIGTDDSGWEKLYRDPEDNRYWELSYPNSEMEGGGPPMLRNLSEKEAKEKYSLL